jgi:hypothetical protein
MMQVEILDALLTGVRPLHIKKGAALRLKESRQMLLFRQVLNALDYRPGWRHGRQIKENSVMWAPFHLLRLWSEPFYAIVSYMR